MLPRLIAVLAFILCAAAPAFAHSWYSDKHDPVTQLPCCGGHDCAQLLIEPGVLSAEVDGYRIRLSLEQARRINPSALYPINALVIWDRVQPSEDGNYHICISDSVRVSPRGGIFCFFAPPNI